MEILPFKSWYLVVGALLVLLVVIGPRFRRLPLTITMVYLALGSLFGALGWIVCDPLDQKALLERLSEAAVIVSLFGAGLKLRLPLGSRLWRLPVVLACLSMLATVGMITAIGVVWLGLPLGAAVILGAVMAPTDPVLASDVQVANARDIDRVRFTLTAEAGINDGAAFPLVMLGLGLLGRHELGAAGWRWWAMDVAWAVGAGLACGALMGMAVGRVVLYLRQSRREAVGLDDFLAIGLISLAYGLALCIHAYGFLAVFAAGLAVRAIERDQSSGDSPIDVKAVAGDPEELASHAEYAPAYMAEAVLHINEQFERIAELTLVILVGSLLTGLVLTWESLAFAALLFCVIRPLAVAPLSLVAGMDRMQTALVSWFGIRGIGSIYYLFYALGHGIPDSFARPMVSIVLCGIALSICVHGITVTPLMRLYQKQRDDAGSKSRLGRPQS